MTTKRQALVWMAAAGALLVLLAFGARDTIFATSVVDLLPGHSVETTVLRELADRDQGRQLTVRLSAGGQPVDTAAASRFREELVANPAISQVWEVGDNVFNEAGTILFENRFAWLLPNWLDTHFPGWSSKPPPKAGTLAATVADQLDAWLDSPEGFFLTDSVPSDPFLLLQQLADLSDLLPETATGNDRYFWIEQTASPFESAGQEPVFTAIETAAAAAAKIQEGLIADYTGVAVFAHASKEGIRAEIARLNLLGLFLVLLITLLAVRKAGAIVRIAAVLILSLLAAATAVILSFPAVHVISLVIGSVLAGIAVDYAFHLILAGERGLPDKTVLKAVITGSLSSAAGFVVLLFAPLPFLRQVGAFVGCGLVVALLAAMLLRPRGTALAPVRAPRIRPFRLPAWTGPLVLVALLPGMAGLQWTDSIRELEYPLPEIQERDAAIRGKASPLEQFKVHLVHAPGILEARDRLEQAVPPESGYRHMGRLIPSFRRAQAAQELFRKLPGFSDALATELENRGYVREAFAPFFSAWDYYFATPVDSNTWRTELARLSESLPGPTGSLVHTGEGVSWFMLLVPEDSPSPQGPAILELDQAGMLSNAFAGYRTAMLGFAGICLPVLALGVLLSYGLRPGLASLLIPLAAVFAGMGALSYFSSGLGLFHLVGGLLAFCIGLDYALFATEAWRRQSPLPASVTVSALTTIGIFGILTTSRIPAVQQLAGTVVLVVATTLLLILAGWPFLRARLPANGAGRLLPHGKTALMAGEVLSAEEDSIEVELTANAFQAAPAEALLEGMAQSAGILMATSQPSGNPPREGVLVVVQEFNAPSTVIPTGSPCRARVQRTSPLSDGLVLFAGQCLDDTDKVLAKATFSIFIPPKEQHA